MSTATADFESATTTDQHETAQLRRSADDRMLAGVAGGLARHLNADATLVRIGVAVLILLTGAGAALYIAAWLLIPADGEDQSVAAAWLGSRRDRGRSPRTRIIRLERGTTPAAAIIAIAVAVIIGIPAVSFALHLLFSPWLLLVAVAVFAWIKLRPRGSRQ